MKKDIDFVQMKSVGLRSMGYDEKWLQDRIAQYPDMLGLGDVFLHSKERRQIKAGRLDLLLETNDNSKRYEVEIQLGATDESHIIRTIEYWDYERQRYRQYDHCAVIIAEKITGRFFNVINLFNGHIPIIAIQFSMVDLKSLGAGDHPGLLFTKILDESLGMNEPEQASSESDWKKYDIKFLKKICQQLGGEPHYTKSYVRVKTSERENLPIFIKARKQGFIVEFIMPQYDDFADMPYRDNRKGYWVPLVDENALNNQSDILKKMAYYASEGKPDSQNGDAEYDVKLLKNICQLLGGNPHYTNSYVRVKTPEGKLLPIFINARKQGFIVEFFMPQHDNLADMQVYYRDNREGYWLPIVDETSLNNQADILKKLAYYASGGEPDSSNGDSD